MDIVHALGDGAAGGGLCLSFVAQPERNRGQREFRGAIVRRQAHRVTQLALAASQVALLVQDKSHQASDLWAFQPTCHGLE